MSICASLSLKKYDTPGWVIFALALAGSQAGAAGVVVDGWLGMAVRLLGMCLFVCLGYRVGRMTGAADMRLDVVRAERTP